jgi:hypothetical protein
MSRASLRLVTEGAGPVVAAPLNAGPPTVTVYPGARADAARLVTLARSVQAAFEGYTTPAGLARAQVDVTKLGVLARAMGRALA